MFLNDGEVPLDNNATEGALRNFYLHKHAWKLFDSIDGAKASEIIYSITETKGWKLFVSGGAPQDDRNSLLGSDSLRLSGSG